MTEADKRDWDILDAHMCQLSLRTPGKPWALWEARPIALSLGLFSSWLSHENMDADSTVFRFRDMFAASCV